MAYADGELLESQIEYYRARVPDYDDWWCRRGRYDVGEAFAKRWDGEIARVRAALDAFAPSGDVLEMAAGTGNWTVEIARHAGRITAVDAAPEAFDSARKKLSGATVPIDWVVADL
ncbi:MAG TPA: class I SAM-dependent methyltransferase, partial [Acidimicrobiia bacterium]|nr:class I SAM-dependent methyltransferase [Acidimicrobiia bacterium]